MWSGSHCLVFSLYPSSCKSWIYLFLVEVHGHCLWTLLLKDVHKAYCFESIVKISLRKNRLTNVYQWSVVNSGGKIFRLNLDQSSPQRHVFVYFAMLNRWKDCSGSLMFSFLDLWRFLFTVWSLSHDSDVRFPGSMSKWKHFWMYSGSGRVGDACLHTSCLVPSL